MRRFGNALQARVLAWLERKLLLRSERLQRFLVVHHLGAFRALLARLDRPPRRVAVVGGGLFPRTVLVLRELLPSSELVVIDASEANVATAREFLAGTADGTLGVSFVVGWFEPERTQGFDLVVIPLGFAGDRDALYASPRTSGPATPLVIHDWAWRRRGEASECVGGFLFRRLNLVHAGAALAPA
jgi:hypothetical protein